MLTEETEEPESDEQQKGEQERESASILLNGVAVQRTRRRAAGSGQPRRPEEQAAEQPTQAPPPPSTPHSVMTWGELERLWATSEPGSIKLIVIQERGVEQERGDHSGQDSAVGVDSDCPRQEQRSHIFSGCSNLKDEQSVKKLSVCALADSSPLLPSTAGSRGTAGGSGDIQPAEQTRQDKQVEHAGSRVQCMEATQIKEIKQAAAGQGDDKQRQGHAQAQQQQCSGAQAEPEAAAALVVPVVVPALPLVGISSMKRSALKKSVGAQDSSGRSWAAVVAGGGVAVESLESLKAASRHRVAFAADPPSAQHLQQENSHMTTGGHRRGVVRGGQAKGAASAVRGAESESRVGVAAAADTHRISMCTLLPWIPRAGSRGGEVVAVDIPSAGERLSPPLQPPCATIKGVRQAAPHRMEEQRVTALVCDSKTAGAEVVSGQHNRATQARRPVSVLGGGVPLAVPTSATPPSASDRRTRVGESHGSLCLRIPVAIDPPTPHMGPLGM